MAFIPVYILILFATIIVNYGAALLMEKCKGREKKYLFVVTILANVFILGFFKYFNFFAENINEIATFFHFNYSLTLLSIILPIGLSFHTFQALSYVIEIYKGNQKPERHFGIYALYVMYYPQLVAGPIERPQNLLPQFHEEKKFDPPMVIRGLKRMAYGFVKKTIIADHLAIIVGHVYANPSSFDGPTLIMATVFFAFQLYCDFSGYSDIAVGSSQVMGIKLMENFNRPYFSKSVAEFWRRWHISLSSWLRDYVYFPLALRSKTPTRVTLSFAIIVTFVLSGLWHGAAWNYVLMGAYFGVVIALSEITKRKRQKLFTGLVPTSIKKIVDVLTTFTLVCVGWVFFRAHNVEDAFYIITHFGNGLWSFIMSSTSYYTWKSLFSLGGLVSKSDFIIAFIGIFILLGVDLLERRKSLWDWLQERNMIIRWAVYYVVIFSILLFGRFGAQEFIYFQF